MTVVKTTTHIPLPSPAPGTQRTLFVHRYGHPGARPKAYFQAALHADETPGLLVLHHLLRLLEQANTAGQIIGEVIVVPVANPIGLDQHVNGNLVGRFDFGSGVNFNRGFPALTDAVFDRLKGRLGSDSRVNTMRIRQALVQAVEELPRPGDTDMLKATLMGLSVDADLVFDLHCDGEALLHLYASNHHRDLASELATNLGAAAVLLEEDPGGSPFDEANARPWWELRQRFGGNIAIPLACFATTVELRGEADVYDHYAEQDAANLFRFLQRRGVATGDPGPLPDASPLLAPLEGVDILSSPAAGVVVYRTALGSPVQEGDTIAELVDLTGDDPATARTSIRSRTTGIFFARMADKLVRPGQSLCKIVGTNKLAHRRPGDLLEQ